MLLHWLLQVLGPGHYDHNGLCQFGNWEWLRHVRAVGEFERLTSVFTADAKTISPSCRRINSLPVRGYWLRSATFETRKHDWSMANIRRILPASKKPHISYDVHESAQPDCTDVLRSKVTCAALLMVGHMQQRRFFTYETCPVSSCCSL